MKFTIYQYNGVYDSFVAQLDGGLKAAIDQRLTRLANYGHRAGVKVAKKLGDGIFECRAQHKRRQPRLLWFYAKGKKIIVAEVVMKEGRVPRASINRAIRVKRMFEENPELLDDLTEIH